MLTTGIDQGAAFTGGAGNDTFIADNTGTNVTNAADSLDGGAGTDTLTVYGFASGDAIPQTKNIENLILDSTADNANVDLSKFTGVTDVTIRRDGGTNAYTVGSGQTVTLENFAVDAGTADGTADFSLAYASSAATAKINLNGVTVTTAGTPANSDVEITGTGLTSVTLNTQGAASTIQNLLTPTALVTINVTGDKDLTINEDLATTVTKVDATNFTGKLSIVAGNVTDDGTSAADFTFIGGSGNDTVDVSALDAADEISINTGAGDDLIIIDDQIDSTNDSVDGGAGTDTVRVSADLDANFGTVVKNVEILELSAAATYANLDRWAGNQFVVSAEDGGLTDSALATVAMQKLASGVTITGKSTNGSAKTASDGSGDGVAITVALKTDDTANTAADTVTFDLKQGYASIADAGTSYDFEVVNLNYTGTAAGTVASVDVGGATKLNIGATGHNLTVTSLKVATDAEINASASTKNVTITTATNAIKSYTGGSGNDTVNLGVAGNLAQGKTFAGGAGTGDKLTATATANQSLGILAVTGFETIELTSNAASGDTVTADFRNVTDLSTLKLIAGDNADVFVLNNFNGTATIAADNDTIGEINIQSTQTTTTLKLGGAGNTTITTLTMDAGATTLNVESVSDTSTITNIAGNSLTTINVKGAGATILDTTLGSTVTTIDASAATGAVTATLGGAGTLKGGSAGDTLGGTSGNDTIFGGAGDDTITGGAGADAINVGTGTDTVVQAANDSGNFTTPAGNSISTTSFDVVTGMAAGDKIDLASGDYTILTATSLAGISISDLQAVLVKGTYDATTGTFVGSASGTDTLFVYDANGSTAGVDAEAIVLVGFAGTATDDGTNGIFTLA